MRVPIRKPGKYTHLKADPHLTPAKLLELKNELEKLKKFVHPEAVSEVRRLAELGDFSENAAYQMAKGRLRGINDRIAELTEKIKHAIVIQPSGDSQTVQLGCQIILEIAGQTQTYLLLGSAETDPAAGVISHQSPIGVAILGRRAGEVVHIHLKDKTVECKILKIE